jgi:hypothetical protein
VNGSKQPYFYGGGVVCPTPKSEPPNWITASVGCPRLPSVPGGRLLHPQPEDAPYCGDRVPDTPDTTLYPRFVQYITLRHSLL